MTAIAVKIVAAALKVFPQFNASIDLAAEEIIFKKYVNIGVAVDTDRGLLVPVVRDADTKNIIQISVELAELSEKARTRKLSLDEMQGGCFSISNLGGIGGTSFTPIVNAPEVAILGISRARMEPVYRDGAFVPRLMLPLSLSYDHRAIDGADGARFLRWVADAFEQPFLLALWQGYIEPRCNVTIRPAAGRRRRRARRIRGGVSRGRPRAERRAHRSRSEPRRRVRLSRLHSVERRCCTSPR